MSLNTDNSPCIDIMSRTLLPVELIDEILEYLHDDNRALAACSLISKVWILSARRHLFADAILNQRAIEKLVKSKTTAIPFVRRLHLQGEFNLRFWNEIFPLLIGFKGVWSLELQSLPWENMTPNAQSVFIGQFASVARLCLFNFGVDKLSQLARVICAFPRLKTLVIDFGRWVAWDLVPSTLCLPHSLRALELRLCQIDNMLEWFLSLERMPPLHTVYLHKVRSNSCNFLDKFFKSLGPSLEFFSYDFLGSSISLGHNTQLRAIFFENTPYNIIRQILSQIVSTHMREVRFTFFSHRWNREGEEWDEVDIILTQPQFSDLIRVEFVHFNEQGPGLSAQELADFEVWVVTHLPRCHLLGILSISEDSRKKLQYL